MEIEQLQMILDAATAAGEGAYWIALIWIAKGFLESCLGYGVGLAALYTLFKILQPVIKNALFTSQISQVIRVPLWDEQLRQQAFINWLEANYKK